MRKFLFVWAFGAASLAGCGGAGDSANQAAAKTPAAEQAPVPYCFFQDNETKGWKASRDKQGNIIVKGKAYREDARYKAEIGKTAVSAGKATIWPTFVQNDTGFAAPDNWWDIAATIANSQSIETVVVMCGDKTIAQLTVPRKK